MQMQAYGAMIELLQFCKSQPDILSRFNRDVPLSTPSSDPRSSFNRSASKVMYVVAASAANRCVLAEYRSLLMRLAAISWRRRTNNVGGIVRMWSSSSTLNSNVES